MPLWSGLCPRLHCRLTALCRPLTGFGAALRQGGEKDGKEKKGGKEWRKEEDKKRKGESWLKRRNEKNGEIKKEEKRNIEKELSPLLSPFLIKS